MRCCVLGLVVIMACSGASSSTGGGSGDHTAGGGDSQAPTSGLRFTVQPDEAVVLVDGEPLGTAAELTEVVGVEPGIHQILVKLPGYRTWRAEVSVGDQIQTIEVTLEPSGD